MHLADDSELTMRAILHRAMPFDWCSLQCGISQINNAFQLYLRYDKLLIQNLVAYFPCNQNQK